MNVVELKDLLESFDDETPVVFAYNYADRAGTIVTEFIDEGREESVVFSQYHRQYKLAESDRDMDNAVTVVLLDGIKVDPSIGERGD